MCYSVVRYPFGHVTCRTHAACRQVSPVGRLYWDPSRCEVCSGKLGAWRALPSPDRPLLVKPIRRWVSGFQKLAVRMAWDLPSFSVPYLATESLRRELFPKALPSAVVDLYERKPGGSGEGFGSVAVAEDEVMEAEVETVLLDESVSLARTMTTTAGPTTSMAGSSSVAATGPPPADLSENASISALRAQVTALTDFLVSTREEREQAKQGQLALAAALEKLDQRNELESKLPPRSSLPREEELNEWESCLGARVKAWALFVGTRSFPVASVEFFPNFAAFPLCYWRIAEKATPAAKIQPEPIVLPLGDARSRLAAVADKFGFVAGKTGVLGGPELLRVDPDDTRAYPFLSKVLSRGVKHFRENRKGAPPLNEFKLFGLLAPSAQEVCPDVGKLRYLAQDDELKPDVARLAFKCPELPLIPKELLKVEFEARRTFLRLVSAFVSFQLMGDDESDEGAEAYDFAQTVAKGLSASLADALSCFLTARRAVRFAAFKGCRNRAEPDSLIHSDFFCESLFARDVVEQALMSVPLNNESLYVKWDVGRGNAGSQSDGSAASASARTSRRRRNRNQNRGRAVRGRAEHVSPAHNPRYEADGAGTRFQRDGRGGRRGGAHDDAAGRGEHGPRRPRRGGRGARGRGAAAGDAH